LPRNYWQPTELMGTRWCSRPPPSLYSELLPRFGGALFWFPSRRCTRRTPKNRYGIYIRCMLIERMRKRLSADRMSFIEPCLPSPADKRRPAPIDLSIVTFTARRADQRI
jgi:hypothetical protein